MIANCILLACGLRCMVCWFVCLLVASMLGLGLPVCVGFVVIAILV